MKHDKHGCACCGSEFATMFGMHTRGADNVASLSAHVASAISRRNVLKNTSAAGIALAVGACGVLIDQSSGDIPDSDAVTTMFFGGPVMTIDADFSTAEAIAIRGDKIISVGRKADVAEIAGPDANLIDLEGRALLPGFIDAHTHILTGAMLDQSMEYVGITRFSTRAEVLAHLGSLAAERPAGEWVVARNYYPMLQDGDEEFGLDTLDSVSTEHPIAVMNASGHILYANSAAFAAAGIDEDIANPSGGEFERDAQGKLTGAIKNTGAYMRVLGAYPGIARAASIESLISTCAEFSSLGLTTVTEHALGGLTQGAGDFAMLLAAAETGKLTQRIRAYPQYAFDKAWDESGLEPGTGDALVRLAGYKLVADGSNQGFTGLQRDPYLNSDDKGLAYLSREELTRLLIKRAGQGWQIAAHGNGDAGIDNILDAVEAARDSGIDTAALRIRIEHCSILHDEQIARMKELGVSASFLIAHVHYWGTAMRDEIFGEAKAQLLDRCASCEAAGVGFTLHSDFFVTDPNPLHMMEMAVTRRTWKEPDYILAPQERVSIETALRAMTLEAAWQVGSDHEIGSLEPGKLADLVILDADPRTVPVDEIKSINVLETWMGGEKVYG